MKRCALRLDPAFLNRLLGLPEGAVVERVDQVPFMALGEVRLMVSGFGAETLPGELVKPGSVLVTEKVDELGERWFRCVATEPWPVQPPLVRSAAGVTAELEI